MISEKKILEIKKTLFHQANRLIGTAKKIINFLIISVESYSDLIISCILD